MQELTPSVASGPPFYFSEFVKHGKALYIASSKHDPYTISLMSFLHCYELYS